MEPNIDTSRIALKLVLILSTLLVAMDIFEIYYAFQQMNNIAKKIEYYAFENCVKYHIITQITFTGFATFAGISAFFMSLGLIIDYNFFSEKVIDTFLYWNYLVFGPYLLTSCILGFCYFNYVSYICDSRDMRISYISFSTLMALLICFFLSFAITCGYSIVQVAYKLLHSIRFHPRGNRFLGRCFWRYVLSRDRGNRQEIQEIHENRDMIELQQNNENNNNNNNNNINNNYEFDNNNANEQT